MSGYDFDGTIYRGDSFIHFYFFCLGKFPYLIFILPFQLLFVLFTFYSRKWVKQAFAVYLCFVPNVHLQVEKFWDTHMNHIKPVFLKLIKNTDIIISASPEFLLQPICKRLGVNHLIATQMREKTGWIVGKNCYGIEKLSQFYKQYNGIMLESFYSDSHSDACMQKVSKKWYYVKGNIITKETEERYEFTNK